MMKNVDYLSLIDECLKDPSKVFFFEVKEYERLRNSKIIDLSLNS